MIQKIKSRSDFIKLQKTGKSFVTPGFVVQAGLNLEENKDKRFGFTATRKIGGAVKRNRAKRRLKELINKNTIQRFNFGMDYVLIARKASLDRDFQDLQQDLNSAINFFQTNQNL
tara:strand:+ start:1934 stop:2278 length:345 start_codon:yes stop_codon:yes gene_type:complete